MKIIEITERNSAWIEKLLDIWETSVKATHSFLSGGEIEAIKQYVPQAKKGEKESENSCWSMEWTSIQ